MRGTVRQCLGSDLHIWSYIQCLDCLVCRNIGKEWRAGSSSSIKLW